MSSVSLADFPAKARKENDESHNALRDLIEQFTLAVTQIHFPTTVIAAAINDVVAVTIEVADANDVRMLFGDNVAQRVQVDVSGSAAGATLSADGVTFGASAIVTFNKGQATVYMTGTGAGTVIGTLVDVDGTGLTLGAVCTVTLS